MMQAMKDDKQREALAAFLENAVPVTTKGAYSLVAWTHKRNMTPECREIMLLAFILGDGYVRQITLDKRHCTFLTGDGLEEARSSIRHRLARDTQELAAMEVRRDQLKQSADRLKDSLKLPGVPDDLVVDFEPDMVKKWPGIRSDGMSERYVAGYLNRYCEDKSALMDSLPNRYALLRGIRPGALQGAHDPRPVNTRKEVGERIRAIQTEGKVIGVRMEETRQHVAEYQSMLRQIDEIEKKESMGV